MKGIEFTDMEIEKLIVIQSVIDRKRTGKEASNKLNLSERQIWRLVKNVKDNGIKGVKYGNCFSNQPRFITDEFKENIKISYTSLYKILTEYGIKSKKKHKDRKTSR